MIGAFGSTAHAHHSAAAFYDLTKQITVEGRVTKYTLGNPHARIYLTVKGPDGKDQEWLAEGGVADRAVTQWLGRATRSSSATPSRSSAIPLGTGRT